MTELPEQDIEAMERFADEVIKLLERHEFREALGKITSWNTAYNQSIVKCVDDYKCFSKVADVRRETFDKIVNKLKERERK